MNPDVIAFVESLLDDWESDEYRLFGEFGVGQDEEDAMENAIAERRNA